MQSHSALCPPGALVVFEVYSKGFVVFVVLFYVRRSDRDG